MQDAFKSVVFHKTPVVLKRQLLPLCLGHVYSLMAGDSPYAEGNDDDPVMEDLAYAVAICSRTFEAGIEWANSRNRDTSMLWWGLRCRRLDFDPQNKLFEAYIHDHSRQPVRFKNKTQAGSKAKHPWPLILATELMRSVGQEMAWNMPLPLAVAHWSCLCEIKYGDRTLRNEEDDRMAREQKLYMIEQARIQEQAKVQNG